MPTTVGTITSNIKDTTNSTTERVENKESKNKTKSKSTEASGSFTCTVKTNGSNLNVRDQPSTSGRIIASIPNKTKNLTASKEKNGWYYLDKYKGWSSGSWMEVSGSLLGTAVVGNIEEIAEEAASKTKKKKKEDKYKSIDDAMQIYINSTDGQMKTISELVTKDLNGIYGVPYQFMASVDQKIDGTRVGKIYADKIITRMPLLLLTPGRVNFMRDYKDKISAAQSIQRLVDSLSPVDLETVANYTGRYYTFDFDYVNYYECVNRMISSGSRFLEIDGVKVNVTGKEEKLGDVDWLKAGQSSFKGILSTREYIGFYVDSVNQVSEELSNDVGESQLSSTVNAASDTAREIQFLLGNTGVIPDSMMDENALANAMSKVEDIAGKYLGGNKLLTDIGKQFATVALGGKLLFPQIWQDSSFTRSYDISMKLRTPDGDKLSWFMNIYVPLCHLVCLTAPKQSPHGVSGYVSPFLVRGYYKGLFNVDMGIITSLSINKGKEGAWTIDGLPTEVDVSITLKDLYSALSITDEKNVSAFVNNITLINYIANTCGININEPDFIRSLDLYIMLTKSKWKNFIPHAFESVGQEFSNRFMTFYQNIGKTIPSFLPPGFK